MKENSGAIVVSPLQIEESPRNIDADPQIEESSRNIDGDPPQIEESSPKIDADPPKIEESSQKIQIEESPSKVDDGLEEGELPCEERELPSESGPCEKGEISCDLPEVVKPEEAENSLKELPLGLAEDQITNGDLREEVPEEEKMQKKRKAGELQEQKLEKKKRVVTAERKKKKKARERIKRAEKERAMGVVRRRPVFKQIEKPPKPPVPCKYFMKGRCSKGESCSFSHDQVPETKLYLCKYFLIGCCLKGDDCPFSHETSKFPCKYLITRGFCKDGDECKFSHKPVSDEEREKIIQRVTMEKQQQQGANGEEAAKHKENQKLAKVTDFPDYDPDWGGNAIDESTPMDQDSFMFRAAKQAARAEIDGISKQDSDYDPCPQEWWRGNLYSSSAPVSEDSFLARQAALQRDQGDGSPDYDPASSSILGVGSSYSSSVPGGDEDSFLSRVAKEAAIKQCGESSTVVPTPSVCSSRLSVADQLQEAMRESGSNGIFF